MFEQISAFFKETNAKQVNITVNPNPNGTLAVVIGGSFPEGDLIKDNQEALNAKANLAQPLVIQGASFEIESNIEQLLRSLTEKNKDQSSLFYSNISDAGSNTANQTNTINANSDDGTDIADPEKGSELSTPTNEPTNTDEDGL